MENEKTKNIPVIVNQKTDNLFVIYQTEIYKNTDRLFVGLMIFQWLFGIAIALIVSPLRWAGVFSSVHIHVLAAVFLGSIIAIFPILLGIFRPGKIYTRYTIAVGQMLYSSLLIHLTGGRIETHFHIFGSLAFLAFYRDWKVLIPATIVVALDHWLRGVYWPQSVFGILTASPYRWIEHAAWVIFEDIFLIRSCIQSSREMKKISQNAAEAEFQNQQLASREKQLIELNENLDQKVRDRTEQLRFDALHDKLTLLPNRALFLDRLSLLMERIKRHPEYLFAVLFIDLDRFKVVNDSLGHLTGDQLLISIADRLRRNLRSVDTAARLGGDEFTILLDDIKNIKEAMGTAQRLLDVISAPINVNGKDILVSASIGIAINSLESQLPEDLLREADTAMYRAKAQGRGRYELFNKDMHLSAMSLLNLEASLKKALQENEFRLYYQPIVSLKDPRIIRMEALIRWIDPKRGLIPPIEFIPFAEETGFILNIGEWVLKAACIQNRLWAQQGLQNIGVSINFSSLQFQKQNLPELIQQTIRETECDAFTLEFEITESTAMKDVDYTVSVLNKLKTLGIKIAIDDFGVGYSSLSCLKNFPIDYLKIDRSFVCDLPKNPNNVAIASAIIGLAHNLNLKVCAEGIEREEQLEFLAKLYCDEGQGYLFSKAVSAEEATKMLLKNKNNPTPVRH